MILRPRLNRNGFFLSYFEYKTFLNMFLRDIVFKRTDIKKKLEKTIILKDHYFARCNNAVVVEKKENEKRQIEIH